VLRDKRANRYLNLDTAEYYPDLFMAGNASTASVAGQFSQVGVFNDGALGTSLLLYDFALSAPANTKIYVTPVKGPLANAGPTPIALNPLQAQREGQVQIQTTATGPSPGYTIFVSSQGSYQWPHEWPIAEIPVGWTLAFTCGGVATIITGSFIWMIEPAA
jgi:hypothetical protein